MKFLVVGCGSIGRRHLRNLLTLRVGELLACEPEPSRAKQFQDEFGILVFSSLEEALQTGPDAALICTPPALHLDIARAAAEAGCHLFIEKPLAHTLEGLEELLCVTEDCNLVTLVGYNWRFHPSLRKIKELIDRQAVGDIFCARLNCGQYLPEWHPWEDYRRGYSAKRSLGGGVLLDSHELDYITWFLGDVEKVSCVARKVSGLEIETEDTADVVLVFRSGAQASLHLDYLQRPTQRSYEFFGTDGTIQWSLGKGVSVLGASDRGWVTYPEPPGFDLNSTYLEELRHFVTCINDGERSALDARRGKYVLELILAARDSAREQMTISLERRRRVL